MPGGSQQPLAHQLLLVVCAQFFQQKGQIPRAKIPVHVGDFALQIRLIPLRQTAGYKHLLHLSALLFLHIGQNGIDGFLLGIVNKTARVDHNHFAFFFARRFVDHVFSSSLQLAHQHLRIVGILGTSQGDDVDAVLLVTFGTHIFD